MFFFNQMEIEKTKNWKAWIDRSEDSYFLHVTGEVKIQQPGFLVHFKDLSPKDHPKKIELTLEVDDSQEIASGHFRYHNVKFEKQLKTKDIEEIIIRNSNALFLANIKPEIRQNKK